MTAARLEPFVPDYATPPGESLRQTLDTLGMSQADLARRTGLSPKHINQIIQGAASLSTDAALAFERVTRTPAAFWTNLEANYQLHLTKQAEAAQADQDIEWVKGFPLAELRRRHVISTERDPLKVREELFAFFGVASRRAWDEIWRTPAASFRRSNAFRVDDYATACWLRIGELEALQTTAEPFDASRFRRALSRIRRVITADPETWEPIVREECAKSGVVVALVSEIKGSRAHGAVRWLSPSKAMLQLSVRQRWEDHFWFSLFHEAGHLLLHGKREAFVDYAGASGDGEEEEANLFARRMLIPAEEEGRLRDLRTAPAIRLFADELRLPPGIVVGRLQHDGIVPFSFGHRLRRQLQLVETGDAGDTARQ
jgi:HTH-type transcriptional regulator/antitoxin HigA